jgi:cell division septum initiation protein DivIVA
MNRFNIVRHGYDINEVDSHLDNLKTTYEEQLKSQLDRINALRVENQELKDKLEKYKGKEGSISQTLIVAVDKAKQIEDNSKKLYDLELAKVRALYAKYETLYNEFSLKSQNEDIKPLKNITSDFKKTALESLNLNLQNNIKIDPIKELLYKVTKNREDETLKESISTPQKTLNAVNDKNAITQKVDVSKKSQTNIDNSVKVNESEIHNDSQTQIKPIASIKLDKNDKYENLVDKFLNDDNSVNSAGLEKSIIGNRGKGTDENGFNLKEAVNPTEDLEDIMKSFDFYNDSDK